MGKKIVALLLNVIFFIIIGINIAYANDTYSLELEILNNKQKEKIDVYILLPKEYIEHCIENDGLNIKYNGPETLIENTIPSIYVEKEDVQEKVYELDEKEYVQILLKKDENEKYNFNILNTYKRMDIKYRVKNIDKDYIIHIDNFKKDNYICKVNYDYEKDEVKQPSTKIINVFIKVLIIILILIIVIGIISCIKKGE